MKVPHYELKADNTMMVFELTSEGPNGKIQKIVQYDKTNTDNLFNLAFGDVDTQSGKLNDLSVLDNFVR
jgi:hypothetical protein